MADETPAGGTQGGAEDATPDAPSGGEKQGGRKRSGGSRSGSSRAGGPRSGSSGTGGPRSGGKKTSGASAGSSAGTRPRRSGAANKTPPATLFQDPAAEQPAGIAAAAKGAAARAGAADPVGVPAAEDAAGTPAHGGPTVPADGDRRPDGARRVPSRRAPRLRTGVAVFLVVAALLGVMVSAVALWAHRVVFDTDAYVKVVAPVARDPQVRAAAAEYIAAKAVEAVDLNDRLESALPSTAQVTAPALTSALQQYLVGEIEKFLATDAAQRLWVDINRSAHRQVVAALRDENRFAIVGRDDVRLDLLPLVAVALQKLEGKVPELLGKDVTLPRIDPATAPDDIRTLLQDALGRKLPADFATITLLHGEAGYQARVALKRLDRLVVLAIVVTVVLIVAALLVSVRRWRAALWLGLGALLAFAVSRIAEVQLEKAAVQAVKSQGGVAVARSVLTSAVASLNGFFAWIAVAGAIVAVAALLAARPEWLEAMGRGFVKLFGVAADLSTPDTSAGRWIAAHLDLLRAGGVGAAVVALLFVTGSAPGVAAVVLALVVYELALTTYAAGIPRPSDEPDATDEETP